MKVIGLTGGIGSGKSTVAKLFADLGVPIIDADLIARELTQPQTFALDQISYHFGSSILKSDGTLNRPQLRQLIFSDPQKRLWLEKLLHPLIQQEIKRQIDKLNAPYCILVIPLLVESGAYSFINRILVVDTSEENQIQRLQERDQMTPSEVKAIMQTQATRDTRLAQAHDVIHNHGDQKELSQQVQKLHELYLS